MAELLSQEEKGCISKRYDLKAKRYGVKAKRYLLLFNLRISIPACIMLPLLRFVLLVRLYMIYFAGVMKLHANKYAWICSVHQALGYSAHRITLVATRSPLATVHST